MRWVSDLCNADGTYVLPNIKDGFRSIQQSQSKYKEIIQERPYKKILPVWRRFLKKHIYDNRWRLMKPLGPWKILSISSDCLWPFYNSHEKNILYRSYRRHWWDHQKYQYDVHQGDDPEIFSFQKFKTEITLPDDAVSCDATNKKNGWLVLDHQPLQLDPLPQKEVPDDINFISFLKSQPEYISQYYYDVNLCFNPFDFYEQLGIDLTLAIASDGGAKPSRGSIGFVLASADTGDPIVTCWGQPAGIDP